MRAAVQAHEQALAIREGFGDPLGISTSLGSLSEVYQADGNYRAALDAAGVAIVSTGSTAKTIAAEGVPVTPLEELTGFPEVLDGRVKTLHPRVHAGLLADLRKP